VPLPLNYRTKCSQTDLLSRASDMRSALVFALLVAATQVSFFAFRNKPHFSFIVGLYSFLRAREPPLSLIRLISFSMSTLKIVSHHLTAL
jgi:hypothetical protein